MYLKKAQELDNTEHSMIPFIEKFKSIKEAVAKFGRISGFVDGKCIGGYFGDRQRNPEIQTAKFQAFRTLSPKIRGQTVRRR